MSELLLESPLADEDVFEGQPDVELAHAEIAEFAAITAEIGSVTLKPLSSLSLNSVVSQNIPPTGRQDMPTTFNSFNGDAPAAFQSLV